MLLRRPRQQSGLIVLASLLATTCVLVAPDANAQTRPADEAFMEGRALMDQGRTTEACQKFAESVALDRRGGALLNLALCREKEGRHATALRLFHEARDRALKDERPDRATLADENIQAVQGRVSWLTVRVGPAADSPELTIQVDGEDLPRDQWGKLRAVDPGPHAVVATKPGVPPFQSTVRVGDVGDSQIVEVPARTAVDPTEAPRVAEPPPEPPHAPPGWRRPVGGLAVALGGAAVVVGVAFGVTALVDVGQSKSACPAGKCKTDAAYRQNQDAHAAARVADITIPIGVVAIAAGVWILLTQPPSIAQRAPNAMRRAPSLHLDLAPGQTARALIEGSF